MTDKELTEECARYVNTYDQYIPEDMKWYKMELCRGPSAPHIQDGYGDWVTFEDYISLYGRLKELEQELVSTRKNKFDIMPNSEYT